MAILIKKKPMGVVPEGSQDKRTEINSIYTLDIQLYICSTNRYLDGKEKPKKTKDKADNKRERKEKTRESEKRSYKKER